MDISDTLAPKSDQLDAVDLLGSPPRIFTVEKVTRGNGEQPVNVHLVEFPRVWRPGKSMRRVLGHLWGNDASQWTGRRVELFCDTEVIFGGEKVGGTRISRMSHIEGPKSVPIIIKKGRSGGYKVDPLPTQPTPPATEPIEVRTKRAVDWFGTKNVAQSVLEGHVGKTVSEWSDADLDVLTAARDELAGGAS